MRETKTKNNSLFNKLTILLTVLLITGAVFAVPVYASSQSVGTIDSDSIDMANMQASISTVHSIYVPENATELKLPVYLNFNNTLLWQNYSYLSGYVLYGATPNVFGIYTGGSAQVVRTYFEPVDDRRIYGIWLEGNSLRVYFDNARITSYVGSAGYVLIGYMIYEFDPAPTGFTYFPPISSTASIIPNGYIRGSAYEYGFTDSIIYALNNASSLEDIFTILNSIDQSTGYLSDILAELQSDYTNLYNLLVRIWNTDTAVLSVDRDIYNTVLSIFALLNDNYTSNESQVAEVVEDVEQNLGNLSHDLEIVKPTGVADIADNYIEQIDTSFNASVFNILFNPTLVLMMCICFALAILSYMLYGGK